MKVKSKFRSKAVILLIRALFICGNNLQIEVFDFLMKF